MPGDAREAPLLDLPELPLPDPDRLELPPPEPPSGGRPCGNCGQPVGAPFPGLPVRYEGFCPGCSRPYSLLPQLSEGERLDGGHYRVRGPLAHGGLGWVYLGTDTRLKDRPVVLKGVLNPHDPKAREHMLDERDQMIAIAHDSIVRIHDYVTHEPGDGRLPAEYIVMEYVGGKSLREVVEQAAQGRRPLGPNEPLTLEHVARYGCQILDALAVLHERGLVYCDMKPDNVIHRGTRVVLIDLGGVQQAGDTSRRPVITPDYTSPEVESHRAAPGVAHDIHTVGVTLRVLASAVEDGPEDPGLGAESFARLLDRAVRRDPDQRFASAAEMSRQLEGVLREMVSLRTRRRHTRPSDVFAPADALLDAGLGAVPGPGHWAGRDPRGYRRPRPPVPPLDDGRPTGGQVAVGLPEPFPAPHDPALLQLRLPAPRDARGVVRQMERFLGDGGDGGADGTGWPAGGGDGGGRSAGGGGGSQGDGDGGRPPGRPQPEPQPSAEARLRLFRARLRLREELPPDHGGRAEELRRAEELLEEAGRILAGEPGHRADADWRLAWHRGLLELAQDRIRDAYGCFDRVFGALPGEYAPKLALGYCAERLGEPERAVRLYQAVWWRNAQQAGAAFGLARVHLAGGERRAAAAVLARVPPASRHFDAARTAAVRIRAAQGGGPPDWDALAEVVEELPALDLDGGAEHGAERDRLTAEIREWALGWIAAAGPDRHRLAALAGDLFGGRREPPAAPPTEDGLRRLLAESFLAVAALPGTPAARHEHLVDCANAVRPRSWL